MKKKIVLKKILVICLLFLSNGCFREVRTFGGEIKFVNIIVEKIYIARNSNSFGDDINEISFNQINIITICTLNCFNNHKTEIIKFYQDQEKTCFLYSYIAEELVEIEKSIFKTYKEYSLNRDSGKIIITLDSKGAYAITLAEYEQNKLNYKPHPYDPSLCKSDPSYEELYKMKGIK